MPGTTPRLSATAVRRASNGKKRMAWEAVRLSYAPSQVLPKNTLYVCPRTTIQNDLIIPEETKEIYHIPVLHAKIAVIGSENGGRKHRSISHN